MEDGRRGNGIPSEIWAGDESEIQFESLMIFGFPRLIELPNPDPHSDPNRSFLPRIDGVSSARSFGVMDVGYRDEGL